MDTTSSVLQIVAHPDDDLYFMNPATFQAMKAGVRTTTVYLTSGDAQGENPAPGRRSPWSRTGRPTARRGRTV